MEEKGLERLKSDWHERRWNYDFVEFMKENKILSTLMPPSDYGEPDALWDTYRLSIFAQINAFYVITYWYTFQVSMLGLGPV
jgi:acyl-CoA dehydrogenase